LPPVGQSFFDTVTHSNCFSVFIAVVVVSYHNEIFWKVALVLSSLSWIIEA